MTYFIVAVHRCLINDVCSSFRTVVKGPEFKYEKIFPLRETASNEQ